MTKRFVILYILFILLFSYSAKGADEESLEIWKDYPALETQRSAMPEPRGAVVSIEAISLSTQKAFNDDSEINDVTGKYNTFISDVSAEYALSKRFSFLIGIPYLSGEIGESNGGYIGNAYVGAKVAAYTSDSFEIGLFLDVSLPTGDPDFEFELLNVEGGNHNFRTGNPGVSYYPKLHVRTKSDKFSFRLTATGIISNEGKAKILLGGSKEKIDVDPGDGFEVEVQALYQLKEKWVPGVFANYITLSETDIEDVDLNDEMNLLEVGPQLLYQLNQQTEIFGGAGYLTQGKNAPAGVKFHIGMTNRF
jgi:Putative MetA-pathway of phenol degradation